MRVSKIVGTPGLVYTKQLLCKYKFAGGGRPLIVSSSLEKQEMGFKSIAWENN